LKEAIGILAVMSSLLFLAGRSTASDLRIGSPSVVNKAQWGSMKEGEFWEKEPFDPYSQGILGDPVAITVHHTSLPLATNPPNPEEDIKKVQSIQHYHISKGWGDVGYHYLIGSDGTIYEGRPLGYTGTHAPPNYSNIGISVIGDFQTKDYPSESQLASLLRVTSWLCDKFDINPLERITLFEQSNLAVCGHRDWGATDCPGDRLYALLPNVREEIRAGLLARAPAYDARISATQFLPETLLSGRQYELPFAIRNIGYVIWSHLNLVRPEPLNPGVLSVLEPLLHDKEEVAPLSNRTWQASISAPKAPGEQRLALRMAESERQFGPELGWTARVLPADAFVSQWLIAGPFAASSPDAAHATDFFAGKPLDALDIMDAASEQSHAYSVSDEYRSGERNYRSEDGERTKDSGRYYRGEESFRLSPSGYKGGDLVLRRRIDARVRDQSADVYLNERRLAIWRSGPTERFRGWKDLDLVIPATSVQGKDSLAVRVKSLGTKQWGCTSFRYTLLDSAEPLVSPKADESAGQGAWKTWKSDSGVTDLSSAVPGVESGALYLGVYVKSPLTKWVELRTGYAGLEKAWMNGKQVLAGRGIDLSFPDTLRTEALLKKGWNVLLLKIALQPGAKDLYVRFSDRSGQPLKGLTYSLDPLGRPHSEWVAREPDNVEP
jgi:hypothetical protein